MVNLNELLLSRDARAALQQKLLLANPGCVVLCLTVQLPGPEKRNALSLAIAHAGVEALQEHFPEAALHLLQRDLETGFEAYLPLSMPGLEAKRIACELEEKHPLGRLMDVDVIGPDGPVSRAEVGRAPRRCLLCAQEARYCMRARTHSLKELLLCIEKMINEYGIQKTVTGRD